MTLRKMQVVILSALILVAATAMAQDKSNKASLEVATQVTVGGQTLTPGYYQVKWDTSNGQVQVTFLQGKKVVATTTARIQPRGEAFDDTSLVTTKKGEIVEVRLKGKKESLVLETSPAQQ